MRHSELDESYITKELLLGKEYLSPRNMRRNEYRDRRKELKV